METLLQDRKSPKGVPKSLPVGTHHTRAERQSKIPATQSALANSDHVIGTGAVPFSLQADSSLLLLLLLLPQAGREAAELSAWLPNASRPD